MCTEFRKLSFTGWCLATVATAASLLLVSACRATDEHAQGKEAKSWGFVYSGGDNMDEVGWYIGNSDRKVKTVGLKRANELGLHVTGVLSLRAVGRPTGTTLMCRTRSGSAWSWPASCPQA